ncbi:MAG: undecaprenyl/decaprenyl-phosphate alpha-N-acetylglucosaminyl 1-phosphate transferase, partial [Solirubrobacterales bacterium]|nr:undecaprenyl/decaprenyl-phosphate alpha-N-acetylglucosaminyl 1-phosphate transferase [Solirubrobacterales bacterium]
MSMLPFLVTMGLAAAISVAATPLFAALARRSGLVVAPRSDRWHKAATPLLGGAAIAAGLLVALAVALPSGRTLVVLLLCAGAAFALGLLDDFRGFAPATKLVGQVMLGAALFIGGIQVEIVSFPPIAFLLTVFWIVAMMNALNLMDNMDGLAAGIAAIAALMLGLT